MIFKSAFEVADFEAGFVRALVFDDWKESSVKSISWGVEAILGKDLWIEGMNIYSRKCHFLLFRMAKMKPIRFFEKVLLIMAGYIHASEEDVYCRIITKTSFVDKKSSIFSRLNQVRTRYARTPFYPLMGL